MNLFSYPPRRDIYHHNTLNFVVNMSISVKQGHEIAKEVSHKLGHDIEHLTKVQIHVDPVEEHGDSFHSHEHYHHEAHDDHDETANSHSHTHHHEHELHQHTTPHSH